MQTHARRAALAALLTLMLAACGRSEEPAAAAGEDQAAAEDAPATIAELTENSDRLDGLFTFFRDRESGAVHMLLQPGQIDREYIYTAAYRDGVLEAGQFRGQLASNKVVSLRRFFDRVEFVAENTNFFFDPENALSRAADANISPAVLAVAEIVAEEDEGRKDGGENPGAALPEDERSGPEGQAEGERHHSGQNQDDDVVSHWSCSSTAFSRVSRSGDPGAKGSGCRRSGWGQRPSRTWASASRSRRWSAPNSRICAVACCTW